MAASNLSHLFCALSNLLRSGPARRACSRQDRRGWILPPRRSSSLLCLMIKSPQLPSITSIRDITWIIRRYRVSRGAAGPVHIKLKRQKLRAIGFSLAIKRH